MIKRSVHTEILELLEEFPAVGLLGPRQVGKTTLAEEVAAGMGMKSVYLDLESPADLAKLTEPEQYFALHRGSLIILDEIQRVPELFTVLRSVIDRNIKLGYKTAQFLVLGSASLDLLQQSSETLAGRIAYKELTGFTAIEVKKKDSSDTESLWLRGGFPNSFLAKNNEASLRWRQNFITTYLERDIPQIGPRIPATLLRQLWTMLAHNQGGLLNTAQLAANLGIAIPTSKRYINLLEDLLLIRSLRPWSGNISKRLVKAPKVYIRDSGITHALLNLTSVDDLLGHPVIGASWEGFVIENILAFLPTGASTWFYRTSAGAEIDLVIEFGPKKIYAIEIKRSLTPTVSKGFYLGCEDIHASKQIIIYPGNESFPFNKKGMVLSLVDAMNELSGKK